MKFYFCNTYSISSYIKATLYHKIYRILLEGHPNVMLCLIVVKEEVIHQLSLIHTIFSLHIYISTYYIYNHIFLNTIDNITQYINDARRQQIK